jgi:hypothetical protein
MKTTKIKFTLLALTVFTAVSMQAKDDNNKDFGSNLLFLPTVAVDMGADAVTLDQTHQTRKYLDSRDSKNNSKKTKESSSKTRSRKAKKVETNEDAQ